MQTFLFNKRAIVVTFLAIITVVVVGTGIAYQHHSVTTAVRTDKLTVSTESYADFSLTYPANWTYKEGTGKYGVYNNFLGPKGPSGYAPSLTIGRTSNADAQTFADGMSLFRTIHPDRTLQPAEQISVKGALRASIIRSVRTYKGTEISSWNIFVLTPSRTALNVEFAAPTAEFDATLGRQLLSSLVAK